MATPTYPQLLDAYKQALLAVTAGQSYTISGRTLTRANAKDIRETITWLEETIAAEESEDDTGIGIAVINFI